MVELSAVGGASINAPSSARPGTVSGHLDRLAESFVDGTPVLGKGAVGGSRVEGLIDLAREHGKLGDATIRQDLMRL